MNNSQIADIFSLLAKLMDIHGENSFKSKSYANVAFQLDKVTGNLAEMDFAQIAGLKGIGDSAAKKIAEILATGELKALTEIIDKTPPGVIEMLNIKGLGPKKIQTVWKEMEIENIGELLYACNENRLTLYKGFGEKTQNNVRETIEYYLGNQGSFLYAQLELVAQQLLQQMSTIIAPCKIFSVGAMAMHDDTIDVMEYVSDATAQMLVETLSEHGLHPTEDERNIVSFKLETGVNIKIVCVENSILMQTAFEKRCSADFLQTFQSKYNLPSINKFESEQHYFESLNISFLPPHLRIDEVGLQLAETNTVSSIIQTADIKGIIHSHSNWSDGGFSLEQMADAAIMKGYEYLVISDHSKTAFYANGLYEERVQAQHAQIDELNEKLAPFKIFKSIESDILNDGSLDYSSNILSTFDLVIASVHSNLKMTEEKAMQRVLKAIENPYTTILGHMTGRLLLSRKGYPLDHKKIIDACVANQVVIELNAHPRRLDMDWRWIRYAIEKGVLISIDPDAHSLSGFDDVRYGVIAAQKGLLIPTKNLSSFSLPAFEQFIADRKKLKGI